MKSDLEIAQSAHLQKIEDVAKKINITQKALINFGPYMAKINPKELGQTGKKNSKLILVTAMSPTPAGEGKTTTTIGLTDAIASQGKSVVACLREPSLGPVFGMKGGATGGGYAQAIPMENINLHFTGDFHAITSANNLLAALIDNHIYHGNELGIDPDAISFKRGLDMNDRSLRKINIDNARYQYQAGFDISVASEVMAIFCLATSLDDLTYRLGEIQVAKNLDEGKPPILAKDLKAQGSMTALLKDAFKPNLVQTLEHNPVLIHGGPFANIAHGCNSYVATQLGIDIADYVVTEAGFGADLGAEKFIDIKCRQTGLEPSLIVIVATIRAMKYHGGKKVEELNNEDLEALERGFSNLERHIENCSQQFGLSVVVAINHFQTDTDGEVKFVQDKVERLGFKAILCSHWGQGSKGAELLAKEAMNLVEKPNQFKFLYDTKDSIVSKLEAIAQKIYRAKGVVFEDEALIQLKAIEDEYTHFPVCIAKTPYSFSGDPKGIGAVSGHTLTIREIRLVRGAGFIVAICGSVMTMPGLPLKPASEGISINTNGEIEGLS
ncbi:MAG: formate--tetrahydrofolate ligase [Nitrosomonadales bacterium]|jgi:formate--tetrahydrofolate ligase|nr:formate--tetrahydrofolate ligase [Nitrosomonadales bacterium]MBT4759898.1 formate--tetrahydrofolate ligase [Nitrosomonadales bacterium]MBT5573624.1 formate--tetrahydrofolate ligase [Nitrosomonadales bacterium]MBT6015078.1 formate--tetrahydrofolate ligase [Nitrosomonadales bacterium]MBT7482448.1 formate--tetrahydrofolate ligase [Nitrosomonadales bacterium]